MNLTDFVDVDFKNEEKALEFVDLNAMFHQTIHNALLQSGFAVEQYPLFTMEGSRQDWLNINEKECRAWAAALSLPLPIGLNEVDLEDSGQTGDWMNNIYLYYQLVQNALGL